MGIREAHLGPCRAPRGRAHTRGPALPPARGRVPPLLPRRARELSDRHGAELPLASALVPALLPGRRALRAPRAGRCRRDRRRSRPARDRLASRATGLAGSLGRPCAVCRSHAVEGQSEQMGDAPGVHDLEARVRRGRLTKRRILKDVPALRFGEGRDCTLPAALAIATGGEYDWLMGCSGAAFTTTIDETSWDPLAATPRHHETRRRMAAAAGDRIDPVDPPLDDAVQALVVARVPECFVARLLLSLLVMSVTV